MTHCDPEALALAAFGERLPPEDLQHLAGCDNCSTEVAELAELVALIKEAPQSLTAPPELVWDAVRAGLGLDGAVEQPQPMGTLGRGPPKLMLITVAPSLTQSSTALISSDE